MTKLQEIEQVLRKSENDGGTTATQLSLTDHQWAALLAALSFWKQQVKQYEESPGTGVYEPCGLKGVEDMQAQLTESLAHVLEEA